MIANLFYCFTDALRCLNLFPRRFVRKDFGVKYSDDAARKAVSGGFVDEYTALLEHIGYVAARGTIVDYGCNKGALCSVLANTFGGPVIGFDVNPHALAVAEDRNGSSKVSFRHVDDFESLQSGSVRLVTLTHSLAFIPNAQHVMREIRRVLSPSGVVVIVTPNARFIMSMLPLNLFNGYRSDQHRLLDYSARRLTRLLRDAGFTRIKTGSIGEEPRIKLLRGRCAHSRLIAVARK